LSLNFDLLANHGRRIREEHKANALKYRTEKSVGFG
jgi:hypothetical protein